MANPIIKIKRGNENRLYSNEFNITGNGDKYLQPLEDGELAYNVWNNGLYIGYNGTNYLLSVANENNKNFEPQTFYGTATNALIASSLGGKTVGSDSKPIYLSAGSPIECGSSLSVDISGNAATATKWKTARDFSINGTASDTTTHSVDGTKKIELTLPKTLDGFTTISANTLQGALATEYITGILPLNKGGTGANLKKETRTPNAIIRYTSSAGDYFSSTPTANGAFYATATDGSPSFGTLPVAQGGTGTTSQTAYRMIISSSTGKSLISSNHFADNTHLYVNHNPANLDQYVDDDTSKTPYRLYVNGISRFNGDISLKENTDITPEKANSSWLGSATKPFYEMVTRRLYLFDGINTTSYGRIAISSNAGAATATQNTYLELGNNIATGTVNNAYGLITLYGHKNSYTNISKDITNDKNNNGSTTIYNNNLYLPEIETANYSGEFVIHKNNTKIGSSSLPIYVEQSGLVAACTPEDVFSKFDETVDATNGTGQTLTLTIADKERTVKLSAATNTYGGIITTGSQNLKGTKSFEGNLFVQGTNPYLGLKDSSGVVKGYFQYIQSSNDFALGVNYASSLQITSTGSISIPASQTITPRTNATGSVGTSTYNWDEVHVKNIKSSTTITITPSTVLYLDSGAGKEIIFRPQGTEQARFNASGQLQIKSTGTANATLLGPTTAGIFYFPNTGGTLVTHETRDVAVGGTTQPVYIASTGRATACKMPASGAWFNALPVIGSDGVVEIGRYIDFHSTNTTTSDYSVRIDAGTSSQGNTLYLPDLSGQVVIHTDNTVEGSASLPVYIAASGKATACTASNVFSDFSSSVNTLSITVATQTRTASIVNSISNTWAGGTTSGPTLQTTVNGVAGTAVAIPIATASASGVVTTDTQTFAGAKTFNSTVTADRFIISNTSMVKHIEFTRTSGNYFSAPASGYFAFIPNGLSVNSANSSLTIGAEAIYPGADKAIDLGTSSKHWGNIHASRLLLTSNVDAAPGSVTNCAITIGATSASHLLIDTNEILAKTAADTSGPLYLNNKLIVYNSVDESTITVQGRADIGCLLLTNTGWTGYGTGAPSNYTAVTGRVYFKLI